MLALILGAAVAGALLWRYRHTGLGRRLLRWVCALLGLAALIAVIRWVRGRLLALGGVQVAADGTMRAADRRSTNSSTSSGHTLPGITPLAFAPSWRPERNLPLAPPSSPDAETLVQRNRRDAWNHRHTRPFGPPVLDPGVDSVVEDFGDLRVSEDDSATERVYEELEDLNTEGRLQEVGLGPVAQGDIAWHAGPASLPGRHRHPRDRTVEVRQLPSAQPADRH